MPIRPESPARRPAEQEAMVWADLADAVASAGLGSVTESDLIPQVDPTDDLERRARRWSHHFPSTGLAELCRFAAGLATVEAAAWADQDPIIATRANEDRRFLAGDRIIHWAVPLLIATGTDATPLLDVGDTTRPATLAGVGEGLQLPGHDLYGPADEPRSLDERLATLWGGWAPGHADTARIPAFYAEAGRTWLALADDHPGTGGFWTALAARAGTTSRLGR